MSESKPFSVLPFKAKWGMSINGINIREDNQATVFCRTKSDVSMLQKILWENYLTKGVKGVLAGIEKNNRYEYAVFVQDGFLVSVTEMGDEE